jgi:hypothetical protein
VLGVDRLSELTQETVGAALGLDFFDLRLTRLTGLLRLLGELGRLRLHFVH